MERNTLTLTQERLKTLLTYDLSTGFFTWNITRSRAAIGKIAGTFDKDGYVIIRVDSIAYKAHRLAWLYVTGRSPNGYIDHIDHVKTNNSFNNLREVTPSESMWNRKALKTNSTGLKGVSKYSHGFRARIFWEGKELRLGVFSTPQLAHEAYCLKAKELHGAFFNAG